MMFYELADQNFKTKALGTVPAEFHWRIGKEIDIDGYSFKPTMMSNAQSLGDYQLVSDKGLILTLADSLEKLKS